MASSTRASATDGADALASAPSRHAARLARLRQVRAVAARLFHHRSFAVGVVLFGIVVLCALTADVVAPHDPNENDYRSLLAPPSLAHLLGTDSFGRDILSRIVHGTRVSLGIGVLVVVATGIMGCFIGALAGYIRWLDNLLMRVMDGLMAFPGVLLAIALAAALGPSAMNAVLALTITFTPRTARVVRAGVLVVREMAYVEAAVAAGAGHLRVLLRHILANALSPLIVQLTYVFAVSILAEAVLSFLGVGPPPPTPSLGNIIAEGRNYIPEAPWVALFPGIAIAIAVLGLNLMGDGLRDVLDPRLRDIARG